MALIHSNFLALYQGVSKQSIDLRQPSHCEEMINVIPSVDRGIRRRNPTVQLSSSIATEPNQFMYTYDRGLAGESEEKYLITIDKTNNIKVMDVDTHEYKTVTYDSGTLDYLQSPNPEIGFSAITIKDTTFIANRDKPVKMIGGTDGSTTMNVKTIVFGAGNSSYSFSNLSPARINVYQPNGAGSWNYAMSSIGATLNLTVDGTVYKYVTKVKSVSHGVVLGKFTLTGTSVVPESVFEYTTNLVDFLETNMDRTKYEIDKIAGNKVAIYKIDGTAVSVSYTITYPTTVTTSPSLPSWSNGYTNTGQFNVSSDMIYSIDSSTSTNFYQVATNFDKKAYIWISQVSPDTSFPYTFTLAIKNADGTTYGSTTSAATSTTGVSSALSSWANGLADFTSSVDGSVFVITRDSGLDFSIVISDTYGNQASSSFKGSISTMDDVPKNFPFKDVVLRVIGVSGVDAGTYWIKYDGNSWVEFRNPDELYKLDPSTMPHKLVRNKDYTFTLKQVEWAEMLVGDYNTQDVPLFVQNKIRDIFFLKGRLGFLTKDGITLSQAGNYFNFWRTTVLDLLDDSPISTYIDSNASVGLEYAASLQGSIIIFGDKSQFAISAKNQLTPATISVVPITNYEINKNVKPSSIGDSVFFVVSRGNYSSVMEMTADSLNGNNKATEVSAHVPEYISQDIMQIVGSSRSNIIFLRDRQNSSSIYVYKYHNNDNSRVQSAWSRWDFGVDISSIFTFGRYLYIFGERYDSTVPVNEFTFAGFIDDLKYIIDETYIVDTEILKTPTFERIDIDQYKIDSEFLDNGTIRYNSEMELSEWQIQASKATVKDQRYNILMKTIEVGSEEDSEFTLYIEDKERGTIRNIPSIYTVDRKPYVSGNAKNMRIKISSVNGSGFQINSISLEGQVNTRSKNI